MRYDHRHESAKAGVHGPPERTGYGCRADQHEIEGANVDRSINSCSDCPACPSSETPHQIALQISSPENLFGWTSDKEKQQGNVP
jgi:hypothetical protein